MRIRAAIGGLLFFAVLGAAQPAVAAGCTGNPDITIFNVKTNTGYDLRFYAWRDGDKIRGKMYFNASRPGDAGGEGSVDGQFYPPSGIFMQVFLYPPAPAGTKLLITGDFFKGDGRGQLKQTNWGADVPQTIWSAETVEGCPKWPNDPEPPKPEPVNILTTDQCEAAAPKSPFPSRLGVTHPCIHRTTSGAVSADVLKALDKEGTLTRHDNGWTTPLLGGGSANGSPVPASAFPCRPGGTPAKMSKSDFAVGQELLFVGLRGFEDCLPRYPRGAGTLLPGPGPVTKLVPEPAVKKPALGRPKASAGVSPPVNAPVRKNDAMGRLDGISGGAINTVSGTQGVAPQGGTRAGAVPCMTCGPKVSAKPNAGPAGPATTASPKPSAPPRVNGSIDYGGCSGCGRGTFTRPNNWQARAIHLRCFHLLRICSWPATNREGRV